MPVTEVTTDPEQLTMTLTAEFEASVDRLWEVFTDPRQLERFWGPPTWPATFTSFDARPGGVAEYHMTGPKGERSAGRWEFLAIDAPRRFEVIDSFVGDDGTPMDGFPSMRMIFEFEADATRSRLRNVSYFDSVEALEQVVAMGAVEGSTLAMNQLDRVLLGLREYAQGKGTRVEKLSDTLVRITRFIDGPRDLVWRAHNDAELMRQWMLGPDGWVMTECDVGEAVGETYRYSWAPTEGVEGEPFGFEGEVLVVDAPRRVVTTERMAGTQGPSTINDTVFEEEDGATLLILHIEYPDRETRDMILATGMAEGMESSYARLERVIAEER